MRAGVALISALTLLVGCGNPSVHGGEGDGPVFTVGDLVLHAASGAAVETAYGYALYLSDQPDTCEVISFVPNAQWTLLELRVAPQGDGAGAAAVVTAKATPAPGEAVGRLQRYATSTPVLGYDAADGTIGWSVAQDGTVTVTALDVGFGDASGRVAASGLFLEACDP